MIEDENVAASYRIDENSDKLMILDLDNYIIKKISYASTEDELAKTF